MRLKRFLSIAAVTAAFAGFSTSARAESILVELLATTPASGGNTTYTYEVNVSPTTHVQSGDFFTFFDFQGYVAGSLVPTLAPGFSVSVQNTGVVPTGISVVDSGSVPNFVFH